MVFFFCFFVLFFVKAINKQWQIFHIFLCKTKLFHVLNLLLCFWNEMWDTRNIPSSFSCICSLLLFHGLCLLIISILNLLSGSWNAGKTWLIIFWVLLKCDRWCAHDSLYEDVVHSLTWEHIFGDFSSSLCRNNR